MKRIFRKSSKNERATASESPVRSQTTSSSASVPMYDAQEYGSDHEQHLLPSFQMHQFYVNRSLVGEDEVPEMPPPASDFNSIYSAASSSGSLDDTVSSSEFVGDPVPRGATRTSRRQRDSRRRSLGSQYSGSARLPPASEEAYAAASSYESERESVLHNLDTLTHLQNKFIQMKVFIAKSPDVDPRYRQVTEDFTVREFQQNDEVAGFVTITNNSKQKVELEMSFTFLYGEITAVRSIGDKIKHTFLRMIDLESSLFDGQESVDSDGFIRGLPASKTLSPGKSYKVHFKFVLPEFLLDTACESEISSHLQLPPSMGISIDSSGWLGSIPDRGYVCHDLSYLSTASSANASQEALERELYIQGGDGIFTNDMSPSGLAISYGVRSLLIGSGCGTRTLSRFRIINDAVHQIRVIPHYNEVDHTASDEHLEALNKSKEAYYSAESLRVMYEKEIIRLENIIGADATKAATINTSSDEERPPRKLVNVSKSKQLELSEMTRRLAADEESYFNWAHAPRTKKSGLKVDNFNTAEKRYLNQRLDTVSEAGSCSIANFLNRSSHAVLMNDINSTLRSNNITLFSLDKLNRQFVDQFSRSSYLKIFCRDLDFSLDYKSPLHFKSGKAKNLWNMLAERKKAQLKQEQDRLSNTSSNNVQTISSSSEFQSVPEPNYRCIEFDLEFVSIKSGSVYDDFQKPPDVKNVTVSLCSLTVDSKHPIPVNLKFDLFVNATNENVDLNHSDNFMENARKSFSFSKHNNTGVVQELRNYKQRLLKLTKDIDVVNEHRDKDSQVVISPILVKSLNSLLTMRQTKFILEGDYALKSSKLLNKNWDIAQGKVGNDNRFTFKNRLAVVFDTENSKLKETLIPSFQTCVVARLYAFRVEFEFEEDDTGIRGGNSKRAVIYVPVEIK